MPALFNETLEDRILRERDIDVKHRLLYEPVWQEIGELMYPLRADITVRQTAGRQKTRRLFDSTALVASSRLAAAMAGVVTPSTIPWFIPEIGDTGFETPKAIDDYLHLIGSWMFRVLQRTDFDVQIQQCYHDLCTFGPTALYIEDVNGSPFFRCLHPGEYAIWRNWRGQVRRLTRDSEMTIRDMILTFGLENLHEEMQRKVRDKEDLEESFHVVQWISYREGETFGFPVDNFPIAQFYLDSKNKHILRRSGFHEWPVPFAVWSDGRDGFWGRSPGWDALPDVASLNKAEELGLRAWAMAVQPPMTALTDGVLGRPDVRPNKLTYVNSQDALQWLPPGTRLDIETVKREDKRKSIWNIFYMDQVQFVPERGKTPPTAEEIRARLNIMLQILGPTLSGLEHNLLVPLLNRVFGILSRSGKIPPPPFAVERFAQQFGNEIDIQFVGPIARAKRQSESLKLDLALNAAGTAAQLDPDAQDVLDVDQWLIEKYKTEMVPRSIIRSKDEIEERRAQRAEQRQQELAMAQAQQGSEVVRNVAGARKERAVAG